MNKTLAIMQAGIEGLPETWGVNMTKNLEKQTIDKQLLRDARRIFENAMKRFYERYRASDQKLQRAVAVLQWGHKDSDRLLIYHRLSCLRCLWRDDYFTAADGWGFFLFGRFIRNTSDVIT